MDKEEEGEEEWEEEGEDEPSSHKTLAPPLVITRYLSLIVKSQNLGFFFRLSICLVHLPLTTGQ
jgi:hypothetical protein